MPQKKSTKRVKYYIKDKEEVKEPDAPVVSDEFVLDNAKEGELAQGQTVTVSADKKFSDDTGTGEPFVMRVYEFVANPEVFRQYEQYEGRLPYAQEIFNSQRVGIEAMLWADGLTPAMEIEPQLVFSKDKTRYLIKVWARPMSGYSIADTPQTLSEIFNSNGRSQSPTNAL